MNRSIHSKIISISQKYLREYVEKIETDQIILICDKNIATLYAPFIQQFQDMKNKSIIYWCGESGEENKTFEHYTKCTHELLAKGIHRHAHLLTIGGGALSDFAGFVAATLLRGISWSVVPTTLLAQIDASIGGKTGLNSPQGKNLIGSFHFPQNIFLCEEFLSTLEPKMYQSGLGELVKYAMLSKDIFVEATRATSNQRSLGPLIEQCAKFKQKIVTQDPFEKEQRKYLNFGHTFGHAYEFLTKEPHGISILWGIEYIDKNFLNNKLKKSYHMILDKLQFTPCFSSVKESDLFEYLYRDKKKTSQNEIQLVLLEDVGRPYLKSVPINQLGLL